MDNKLNIRLIKTSTWLLSIILFINVSYSQTNFFKTTSESKVKISGTSSLHDWHMEAPIDACDLSITKITSAGILELTSISLELPVNLLKSNKKKMDKIAYKALQSEEFPVLKFKSADIQQISIGQNGVVSGKVKGVLEIAGVQKNIILPVSGKRIDPSNLSFQFEFSLNMEDYKVEPPSFMFGAVTTGSEIKLDFTLKFNELNQLSNQ